jgi:SIR2-like domain
MSAEPERADTGNKDVELVLVTGAGASRDLGHGDKKIPLMYEWSDHLVKRLAGSDVPHAVQLTGLTSGLNSVEFEERLGRFLTTRLALAHVADLVKESAQLLYPEPATFVSNSGVLETWHRTLDQSLTQIENVIQKSLYDLYAGPEFDLQRAAKAYRELVGILGISEASAQWVYATTNYDPIGEMALEHAGYPVEWGERQRALGGHGVVDVERLTQVIGRSVPVLHLHGRVGWYRRTDGVGPAEAYAAPVTSHDPANGTPILMLPNPEKPYESDEIIMSLWRQFEDVLRRARRVLVLGHSLQDERLVQALFANVESKTRLAVTAFAPKQDLNSPVPEDDPIAKIVRDRLPGAKVIPIRFASDALPDGAIEDWFAHMRDLGL